MRQVSVFEAKTHLSALINQIIDNGDSIEITRHGHPVVRISPVNAEKKMDIKTASKLMDEFRKKNSHNKITIEEVMKWKEEGRA